MNPNAKEFVPAHILRKRQDEAMGSLAKQMGDVDLNESKKVSGGSETSCDVQQNSTRTSSTSNDKTQNHTENENTDNRDLTADPNKETGPLEEQSHKAQPNSFDQTNERSNNHHDEPEHDFDEDDRYLLKAGENYCEFNGEQFIIPGDDDEYDNENPGLDDSHHGYDFGNAEDNEDEDVINAYDAFLSELP